MKEKQIVKLQLTNGPAEVGKQMRGYVISHPFHERGTDVVTSPVLAVEGNYAETKTYRYELS